MIVMPSCADYFDSDLLAKASFRKLKLSQISGRIQSKHSTIESTIASVLIYSSELTCSIGHILNIGVIRNVVL